MHDAVAAYRNDADRHGHRTEQRTEGVCFDPGHGPQATGWIGQCTGSGRSKGSGCVARRG